MSHKAPQKKEEAQPYQRENLIKLQSWVDREIRVRFSGGRQVTGILKGYDNSNNMIVDDTIEYIRGAYLTLKTIYHNINNRYK